MEYEVQLAPIDRSVLTGEGFFEPLCNTCCCPDCSNPIEERSVSVAGVVKKIKLYVINDSLVRQVIGCRGFTDVSQQSE